LQSAHAFETESNFSEAAAEYLAAASRYTGLLQLNSALELTEQSVESAGKTNRYDIISRALGLRGNILAMQGKFEEGTRTAQKGLSIALQHKLTEAASEVYRRLASTMEYASDYASAKEAYKTAYNYCVSTGSDVYAQICLSCMSYVLFQTGDWKQSLDVCRDVINNEDSPEGSKLTAYGMAGIIYAFRGEVRKAKEYLDIALDLSYKYDTSVLVFFSSWGQAIIAENENNAEELEKHYYRVLNAWHDSQDRHDIIPILLWASAFFADNKINKELTFCAEALSKIASDTGNPEALSCLAAVLGEIAATSGDYSNATKQFEQALIHQAKLNVPLEKLFIEFRYAKLLAECGYEKESSNYYLSAFRLAKKLGMRPFAAGISGKLKQPGKYPGMISIKTSENTNKTPSLTKRQLEILHLLAEGITNKEIAEKLFLSSRTIDMHVSHIFERLNCRTRTEAIMKAREMSII
jgi:ATP/maltotriose-dependent transcriptional regulator MalT